MTPEERAELKKDIVSVEGRRLWHQVFQWPDSCEEGHSFDGSMMDFFSLREGVSLVEVTCLMGAYQGAYRYYVYDETKEPAKATALLSRRGMPEKLLDGKYVSEESTELVGTPEFDPKTKELGVLTKGAESATAEVMPSTFFE